MLFTIKHRRKYGEYEITVTYSDGSKEPIVQNIETKDGAERIVVALNAAFDIGFESGWDSCKQQSKSK